jgi:hypothetical protein
LGFALRVPADFLEPGARLAEAFFLAGLVFLWVLATALVYRLVVIADMEMATGAAVRREIPALDLDRAALGPEPFDLGLSLLKS